jgi:hypothetical protein
MVKKQVKNHPLDIKNHIGNDFVFFYLQLIDYPEFGTGEIAVRDLKNYRFERLDDLSISHTLLNLEEDGAIGLCDNCAIIKITKKTTKFIWSALEIYIVRFIKGELVSFRGEPYKFKKQKRIFLEKIEERIGDSQSFLNFSDADFLEHGDKFCFFSCVLALEKQGEIKVESIYNERLRESKAFYHVAFRVKDNQLREMGIRKEERHLKLKCFKEGKYGYFQIKASTTPREVGLKRSREYLLLVYLVSKGVGEEVSFKQAYEAIKDGKHYDSSKYANEMERVIENAKKQLQKKNKHGVYKIRPYKVVMETEREKVRLDRM